MADVIRDVVVRIGVEQKTDRIKTPDFKDATKSADKFTDAVEKSLESLGKTFEEVTSDLDKLDKEIADTTPTTQQWGQTVSDESLKVGEGLKAATEGAFTLARGVAFMAASNEEDFQKVVQNIAMVQGGFDAFKGSIEMIKGITDAQKAMSESAKASVITTQLLSASFLGPAGAIAALTAAAIAYLYLIKQQEKKAEMDREELRRLDELAKKTFAVNAQTRDRIRALSDLETQAKELDAELAKLREGPMYDVELEAVPEVGPGEAAMMRGETPTGYGAPLRTQAEIHEPAQRERLGVQARNEQARADEEVARLERRRDLLAERKDLEQEQAQNRVQDIQARQRAGLITEEGAEREIAGVEQRSTAFIESITEGQKQIEKLLGAAIINQNKFNSLVENMDDMEVHTISAQVGGPE